MVRPKGFEPLTYGSGGRRSIQLSYGRMMLEAVSDRRVVVGSRPGRPGRLVPAKWPAWRDSNPRPAA